MLISATPNVPFAALDTFFWAAIPNCLEDCSQQWILPTETTLYNFTVIDENGCVATDELRVNVRKDRLIYIPNAFSPDGNEDNELFMIYGGEGVDVIQTFQIFNRWGEIVFSRNGFQPDDPLNGWNGRFRGELLNPGVFVYYAKIRFADGHIEQYQGDVTLMR